MLSAIPEAVIAAVTGALGKLAVESLPTVVETIEHLTDSRIQPEALVVVKQLVAQIASSPTPLETAKRAVLATASSEATDAALRHLYPSKA